MVQTSYAFNCLESSSSKRLIGIQVHTPWSNACWPMKAITILYCWYEGCEVTVSRCTLWMQHCYIACVVFLQSSYIDIFLLSFYNSWYNMSIQLLSFQYIHVYNWKHKHLSWPLIFTETLWTSYLDLWNIIIIIICVMNESLLFYLMRNFLSKCVVLKVWPPQWVLKKKYDPPNDTVTWD